MWQTPIRPLLATLMLVCLARPAASAQQMALAGRAPRFLAIPKDGPAPVEISPSSSAALRATVSLRSRQATIGSVLEAIEAQTGLEFVYSRAVVPVNRRVGLQANRITVAAALTEVLLETNIDVVISADGQLTLVQRASAGPVRQPGVIVGQVTDKATGNAVMGTDVLLDGTQWRTMTDSAGRYVLAGIDPGSYELVTRRLGYSKQTLRVDVRDGGEDTVNVALQPVAVSLNELVTTATGQQRRRDLGNAITTIRADSVMRTAPIRSLTDLLEDRVPGLNVQHTSGAPGDPARLRLRGISSVMRGNDPVVVIDGIRAYSAQSDARSGNLTNLGTKGRGNSEIVPPSLQDLSTPAPSPLDQIDPNTIEKIEVFKGPSAATLYGADAANGVIVITTKRGKPGPTQWDVSVTRGQTSAPGRYPEGYYQWGHDLLGGALRFCTLTDLSCVPDSLAQFQALNDPELTVLGRGERTSLSLTGSGGSQALTYSLTGTYEDETGLLTLPMLEVERFRARFNGEPPDWMRRPHQLTEWSVRSNVTARLSATADVTLSSSLSRTEQERSSLERQVSPLSGTYVDRASGLYYRPNSGYILAATTDVLQDYYTRTTASSVKFTTGLTATWRPSSWFDASGQAGLDVIPRNDQVYLPAGLVATTDSGVVIEGTGRSLVSTFNLQGAVRKPLRWGFVFETRVGANLLTTNTRDLVTTAAGLLPGTRTITGASQIDATNDAVSNSVFGWYIEPRITGQRLSFSTGIRLDGGSNYGARVTGGGLLSLPKLNGSWVISEEPFFPFKSLFSSLRLRGAYGQAQVQPGVTDRLRLYTRRTGAENAEWLKLTTIGNSQLRPERSTEFEGGFDADLLDSRVSLELTGYRKMQVDALMPVALPASVNGGGSVVRNIGNILNKGVELTLRVTPIQSPALTWSAQFNYAHNDNELTKLGRGVTPNPRQGIVAGYPVGSRWARPILGYGDANGNGVLQPAEIRVGDSLVFLGRLHPSNQSSLHTNVALFGGAIGITAGFNYESGGTQVDETARTNWVLARGLIDASTPWSEQAAVLVYDSTTYGLTQDISTFRFNELSVSYRAPTRIARFLRAQQLSVAVQGRNLGLHSTYRGKDPDVSAWSPTETVVDTGQLPLPRTWQLAVFLRY